MNTSQVRELPANTLIVDPRVQRVLDPVRVRKIANTWDDLMVGVLTVSHRLPSFDEVTDEQFVVLDGQTRLEAFRAVCGKDTVAPLRVEVHEGLTLKEEAAIFLRHNDRKGVTPLDRYRIALVAGEEWATDIYDIAEKYEWFARGTDTRPGYEGKIRRFESISAVEKIYRADQGEAVPGTALLRVFATVGDAWPNETGTITSETINGLGMIFSRHPDLDHHGLTHKLKKIGYYKYVSGIHDTRRGNSGMSVAAAAYAHTLDIYNLGRRSRRIDA